MTRSGEAGPTFTGVLGAVMGVAGLIAIVGVVLLSRYHPEVVKRRAAARSGTPDQGSGTSPRAVSAESRTGHADQ